MTDKVVTLQSKNGRGRAGVYPMHTRPKLTGMEHFNLVHDVRDQLERGGMEWKDAADYSWLVGRRARKAAVMWGGIALAVVALAALALAVFLWR